MKKENLQLSFEFKRARGKERKQLNVFKIMYKKHQLKYVQKMSDVYFSKKRAFLAKRSRIKGGGALDLALS